MVKLLMANDCMPRRILSTRLGLSLFMSLLLLCLSLPGMAQTPPAPQAQGNLLSAFVDSTNIAINEVITLTVRIDSSIAAGSRPQFSGLNREFEQVGGISSRNTYTNNNGDIQSWTEYSIRLRPLTTGTLTIPAFRINGQVSNSIQVKVGDARQTANAEDSDIFLRTEVSKDSVYVQEQLLYTIKIFWSVSFDQGAQLTSPQVSDAVVQQLGSDANYQDVVNGIGYNVTERKFVIFPQKSGELTIPPVNFSASVGRRGGFNALLRSRGTVREIDLTSETHHIEIKAQPASFPAGATWLPARQLALEESWSGDFDNLEVGDALTRNITLRADGLSSSLLPGIPSVNQDGLRFYPDQPLREDGADASGVFGKRSEGTAIVPSRGGEFTLPEVRLPWWNTETDQLETATLPARTINVLAPTGSANPASILSGADAAPQEQVASTVVTEVARPVFWITTTVLFAGAWAFTTLLWLRGRQQATLAAMGSAATLRLPERKQAQGNAPAANPNADAALRTLKAACDGGRLREVRATLLSWGQAASGNLELRTLDALSHHVNDDELSAHLHALDAALYGNGNVDCRALYSRVAALHKQGINLAEGADKYGLPPLYKQ
jgi:hypothetical protein